MVFRNDLLKGEVAFVTGAARGIGKAAALALAEVGAQVVICGRNMDALKLVENEITEAGGCASSYVCDVTDYAQVDQVLKNILEKFGKIDILVNNAGISQEKPFDEFKWEEIEQIITTNELAPIYLMYRVLPLMVERKHGHVINIGSGAAVRGLPKSAAYAASKSGMLKYAEAVGDEVWARGEHHVHVNTICPGPVDTEMFQQSEVRGFIMKAGGDVTSTREMANAIIWLSTEELSGVTNSQTLILRGFNRW